ncbi:MAG: CapA family protein [Clostridia bacterium]|nr:CapA family protein [Clostridia bacterium]
MKIALLGDLALIGRYDTLSDSKVSERVAKVAEATKNCDFVIANLESPFTTKQKTHICKGVYLKSDPRNVSILKDMNITHVTLANNHTFDYGVKGAEETIRTLEQNGIGYVGLCNEPALLKSGSEKVLLEGFCCYSANGVRYGNTPMHLRTLCEDEMSSFFEKARKANAFPIASVHFGIEGVHYPSPEHLRFFRSFAKEYNYILHGNHPHAIQGIEQTEGSLLYYACGDLCFDDATETSINSVATQSDESRQNYIAIINIEENKCTHMQLISLSDLPDGIIKESEKVSHYVKEYSENLSKDYSKIATLRKTSPSGASTGASKRNLTFFTDRLNYKYIGAYINGKLHARKYRKLFSKYFTGSDNRG